MVTRRHFALSAAAAASLACQRRGVTTEDWTRTYLERIAAVNPLINAVIEMNPDAMRIAHEVAARPVRGAVHGWPVFIKDNIDTADRMMTTAGSLALVGAPAPAQDAPVVTRLRAAGAVLLGKTNLSEWANLRSTRSTSGWSARGGQTRNPHDLLRNPSGSSSGSGAAVAAGLCEAAVGTETDGSIVSPASINGIVGIKPTLGLVSAQGIIPIAYSQDTAGPMARTVLAAARLLSAINERGVDFAASCQGAGALRGKRIGVARGFLPGNAHPGLGKVFEENLRALRSAGAELIDNVALPSPGEYGAAELTVLQYELRHDLNAYLATRTGARVHTLAEVIAFNERESRREMPHFGQEHFIQSEARGPLTERAYLDARALCVKLAAGGIDTAMKKLRLNAIAAPTDALAWLTDYVNGDHFVGGCSTPPAVAGYPHITVPGGFVDGLPAGFSFFGRAHSDGLLISLAHGLESITQARRSPRIGGKIG
ncbi:MAG: amidase [Acidobacteria bacterium]|nr:amidase [Acidobacteriota bacterium]